MEFSVKGSESLKKILENFTQVGNPNPVDKLPADILNDILEEDIHHKEVFFFFLFPDVSRFAEA